MNRQHVKSDSQPTLLAIDTATEAGSVCLFRHGQYYCSDWLGADKHVESVLSHIKDILKDSHTKIEEVSAIVFSQGPGSFTGLRAGCGITQGLAFSLDVPVIAVPTLLMLAEQVNTPTVLALLDARMGQVYGALYKKTVIDWQEIIPTGLYQPDQLPELPNEEICLVGSGADGYADQLRLISGKPVPVILPNKIPHAKWLIKIGLRKWHRGEVLPSHDALPIYIRDKVALTTAERQPK